AKVVMVVAPLVYDRDLQCGPTCSIAEVVAVTNAMAASPKARNFVGVARRADIMPSLVSTIPGSCLVPQQVIRLGNGGNREYALTLSGIPMAKATWDWEGRIGRRVRLRDLHILSAVVRWGSMAKAASNMAMSQSAVSEAVASLEDALQVRLLDRTPRGIEPTIFANALLKRGAVVFDELRQGIRDIEFLSDPTIGEVRVSSPEILSAWLVPAAIESLLREHPKIFVRVYQQDAKLLEFRELYDRNV